MSFNLVKLGDICRIGSSKRIKRADYVQDGIPFFRSKEVIELSKGNSITTELFISKEQFNQINEKFGSPDTGDILITSVGTLGVAYHVEQSQLPFYFKDGNLTWLSQFSEDVNPRWVFYWLNSPEGQRKIDEISIGSTQRAITIVALKSIEFQLPHKDEQDRTVKILDSVTKKISTNDKTNQTLEQIAQAIFKSWFVDFDPVKAKIDALTTGGSAEDAELAAMSVISAKTLDELKSLKASNPEAFNKLAQTAALFPAAMQDSELGEIPEGWDVLSVQESFKVVMGQSPKGDTYNDVGEGTLFYQGRAEFGWRFPTPRLYTTDPKRMASKGDVLMSVRAPVGDLNIAMNDCCVGRGLCSLLHNSSSTSFTYYLLKSLQRKLDSFNGEGTVFGSINQKDLKAIRYVSASKSIIESFIEQTRVNDQIIEVLSLESITLVELRDSLLPKLLAGKV
jgi:type I restriction enzyme S subunit